MKKLTGILNAEYSAVNGCYWMVYGIALSFAAVFLQARGYTNSQLGAILAAGNILALLLQPAIADLADRSEKINLLSILRTLSITIAVTLVLLLFLPTRSVWLTVVYSIFLACVFAIQPFSNSLSMYLERWGAHINFGVARGIGSLSYALIVVVLGVVVERTSVSALPAAGLAVMALFIGLLVFLQRQNLRYGTEKKVAVAIAAKGGIGSFFKTHRRFAVFLVGTALVYFPHSLFNNFIIEAVVNVGGGSADMGALCCVSALLEIPAMFLFDRLTRRFRCSSLLKFAVVMFTVKEIAIYFACTLPQLYAAQIFQGMSFAVFIPATVRYVNEIVEERDAVKGQAFITSMITLGSIFASFIGGFMFDILGASRTLLVGAAVSAIGTVVSYFSVQDTAKRDKNIQG